MTNDDPNEAYEVVPIEPRPHGPPKGCWTVKRNGIAVRHFPGKEKAKRPPIRNIEQACAAAFEIKFDSYSELPPSQSVSRSPLGALEGATRWGRKHRRGK
jgi:hypothetical protein